jgi:sugar lactone lactonase YvrE/enterochelin esterase-like enzyme
MPHRPRLLRTLLLCVLCASAANAFAEDYQPHPDTLPQDGVPKGSTVKKQFANSKVFPGTVRDYSIYVPAQYDKAQPACVMVFQDHGGGLKVATTFDNLIAKKDMPVTIAILVSPGVIPPPPGVKAHPRFNRSYEYDSPTDLYARFLIDELIPEVAKEYNLTKEATGRAICGNSSGGIAAFVAAWERPDYFSRVVSFIGSFTNLRGGHDLASLIRKTEPKPIRVYLQDGKNDLDIYSGHWFIGNTDVAAALAYAGYEHQFVTGTEGHNGKHAAAVFPDALRYVWKDYPAAPKAGTFPAKDKRNLSEILIPGQGWELVSENHKFTEGPSAAEDGVVYFADGGQSKIYRVTPAGNAGAFIDAEGGCDGMAMGPNHKLYVNANKSKEVVTYDLKNNNKREVIAAGFASNNDLVVTQKGAVYVTDHADKKVWYIPPGGGEKKVVDTGINFPNGIVLTPDQTQLIVADMNGPGLYSFTIKEDGTLANKALYYYAQIPPNKSTSGADGLTVDASGNLYACTGIGIQVFDQAGRVTGIIPRPVVNKGCSNIEFGGVDREYLYATCGDKVFRRKTKQKGVLFFNDPILPPAPRL